MPACSFSSPLTPDSSQATTSPLRSSPARGDRITTFTPESACRNTRARSGLATLELIDQHQAHHAPDGFGVVAMRDDFGLRFLVFDEVREDRIEYIVRRQRILVGLVVAQFRRWRAFDHGWRDSPTPLALDPVAPLRQPIDDGLVDIFQRRVGAAHIAVQSGIADRHLALVAGGKQQAAMLVR